MIKARAAHPGSRLLGGGTDLIVNIRRGIVAPPTLIDVNGVTELRADQGRCARHRDRRLGHAQRARPASRRRTPLSGGGAGGRASSPGRPTATWGRSAAISVSTPAASSTTRANGGASANHHCLKTTGDICHVAPKSRGVCFATFSGDLAPALLTLGAEVDLAGPDGRRTLPLEQPLYRLCAAGPAGHRDARRRQVLSFAAARRAGHGGAGEQHARPALGLRQDPHPALDRVSGLRRRGGVAARAATRSPICASPSPAPIRGRCCSKARPSSAAAPLDDRVFKGLDELVRDQIMSMKTTFTPGHYRRRVAGVLARRLVTRLFEE